MVEFRKLTDEVSVAGQISPKDVADIAKAGFRAIVCNRPDGEAPDQPRYAEVEQAAKAAGLTALFIPVTHGQPIDGAIEQLASAYPSLPKPVLLYCRSGARSTILTQHVQARGIAR